jgi:hypothetical protein
LDVFGRKFKHFRVYHLFLSQKTSLDISMQNVFVRLQVCLMLASLCFITGCSEESKAPSVSHIEVNLNSRRLDKDLEKLDTLALVEGLKELKTKYPDFLDFYLDTLMGFGIRGDYSPENPAIQQGLYVFLTHPDFRGVFDSIQAHYADVQGIEANLSKGFQYLKYYFPDYKIPSLVYISSGLNNWAVFTYDTLVGIGLDMYLGANYPFYRSVGIPDYISRRFSEPYIAPNVFQAIYRDWYPFVAEGRTLLDMMLQRGKEQYFLKKILPFVADSVRIGYTKPQLAWCEENEAGIYNFFVKDNLLYETNWQKILRYVNDGPNSVGMPPESPGNIGSWLGLKIIEAYMRENPQTTLPELLKMNTQDAQQILYKSKYKPR